MITDKKQSEIRRAKKESLYYREISTFFMRILLDDQNLNGLHINAVKLSPTKSVCSVLFNSDDGQEDFKKRLPDLILYKPALRKAISQNIRSRYTPDLVFKYDVQFEKQYKIESLFDRLKQENKL
ncbi:ribosome-binding factor A [bacterium]|nr:ribosome-binding factor A [bacterium]